MSLKPVLISDPLRMSAAQCIHGLIPQELLSVDEIYSQFVLPPNPDLGHLSFGCFILSKLLKKSPVATALDLKSQFQSQSYQVEAAGPYLNFKFSTQQLYDNLIQQKLQKAILKNNFKIMIEYSQPNTHKELHVGHMRNLCLGDAIVNLLREIHGKKNVISTTFPGDVGTHVAKCLWYIKRFIEPDEFSRMKNSPERGEWLGRMYSAANLKLEDEEKTEKFQQNKLELTEILKQLEKKQGDFFDLWIETRQWSIDLMNRVYAWAGVEFDRWYWESEVDADSVLTVKKYLAEGKLQVSQGAVGVDLENEKLGFCMLLKSDGTGLYATKDLELARRKFEEFGIDQSIYIVDQRQNLHFKQVFKVLEMLGFQKARDCVHLPYNFVELPDGAMSSRKGNIVPLMQLVDQMQSMIKTNFLGKYTDEWSSAEIDKTANQVAAGAIKYGMIRQDSNKKIVFDMNEWLKIDGESGPFIQYSAARINSLIQKFGAVDVDLKHAELLNHKGEIVLLSHLNQFFIEVQYSAINFKPASLCSYLYELAKKFNSFYHDCSIGQAETKQLQQARLSLCVLTLEKLSQGLALLGIPTPQKM